MIPTFKIVFQGASKKVASITAPVVQHAVNWARLKRFYETEAYSAADYLSATFSNTSRGS